MRVVYYPFNTNTRLALDSSRSNALSISKQAEEWWFNFGGEVGGLFSSRKNFFSQTLNPLSAKKISQKLNCNFRTHTHTETRLNAFHTTLARREIRAFLARKGRKNTFCLCFFFGVLLVLDTNFASLARAFSALFWNDERIYGPCPHKSKEVTVHLLYQNGEEE